MASPWRSGISRPTGPTRFCAITPRKVLRRENARISRAGSRSPSADHDDDPRRRARRPCVTHVGPDGAGHFVKMVHNGIEYGDMQIIAEVYDVLHRGLGLSTPDTGAVFDGWNKGPLGSFLVELTAHVCGVVDPQTKQPMVDVIQDKAGQKGTGK